jgi:hypothetical protein
MTVIKFVSSGERIVRRVAEYGWWPAARYTNLRTVRWYANLGFLDIDWKNYNFNQHLAAAAEMRPVMTVARDVTDYR